MARTRRARAARDAMFPGFEDVREIGLGSIATVYEAREVGAHRLVALKLLNVRGAEPRALESFERESVALGAVSSHPNIVTLYRSFPVEDGRPVLVLELCAGSMADRLHDGGRLSPAEGVALGIKIAGALETAHRAGILHRDVKPQNILVTEYGEPALADFGVAMLQSATQTTTGLFDFTTLHAAPELLEGRPTSAATDVYELASTLYQLVAGRAAFRAYSGESPAAVILRILRDPVQPLVDAAVPTALSDLLLRAMSKDIEHRPATALEFASELATVEAAQGWPRTAFLVRDGRGRPAVSGPPPVTRLPEVPPSWRTPARHDVPAYDPPSYLPAADDAPAHRPPVDEPSPHRQPPVGDVPASYPPPAGPRLAPPSWPEPMPASPQAPPGRQEVPKAAVEPAAPTWQLSEPDRAAVPQPPEPDPEPVPEPEPVAADPEPDVALPQETPDRVVPEPERVVPEPEPRPVEPPVPAFHEAPAVPEPEPVAEPADPPIVVPWRAQDYLLGDPDVADEPPREPPEVPAVAHPERTPADAVADAVDPTGVAGSVPTWTFRMPIPGAGAGPAAIGDVVLDPDSLQPRVTIRQGSASLTIDDTKLSLRAWLKRSELPWAEIHAIETRWEPGDGASPTPAGYLVAVLGSGEVELPATRRSGADLRYTAALLEAYRLRAQRR